MNHTIRTLIAVACGAAVLSGVLPAQTSTTATVLGTVTDATEAVIPGVSMDLVEISTNQARRVASNEFGLYLFVCAGCRTASIRR